MCYGGTSARMYTHGARTFSQAPSKISELVRAYASKNKGVRPHVLAHKQPRVYAFTNTGMHPHGPMHLYMHTHTKGRACLLCGCLCCCACCAYWDASLNCSLALYIGPIYIHKCVQANAPPILTKAGINRNVNVRTFVLSCGIYR